MDLSFYFARCLHLAVSECELTDKLSQLITFVLTPCFFCLSGFRQWKWKWAFRSSLICESLCQCQWFVTAVMETPEAGTKLFKLHGLGTGG